MRRADPTPVPSCAAAAVPHAGDDGAPPQLAALRAGLDARLAALVAGPTHETDRVGMAMREALLAPGKRVRPLLLLLATWDLGGEASAVLDAACALEMVHAASLLVDDLPCMDNGQLRRGLPTAHVRHGQDVAILAAIGLLGLAFRVVAASTSLEATVRTGFVAILANAVGTAGLVQGQYRDLQDGAAFGSADAIARTNQLKTGSMFSAAVAMAALATGAAQHSAQALQHFAVEFGQAFQLLDDLADMTSSAAELGKDVGQDAARLTLPALLGVAAARGRLDAHLQAGQRELDAALGTGSRLSRYMRWLFDGLAGADPGFAGPVQAV